MPWPDAMRVSPLGTSQNLTGMPCKIWLPSSLNHRPQAIFLDAFIDRFRDRIGNEMKQYASQSVESRASTVSVDTIARRKQISSRELFDGSRELLIEHAGNVYLLRQTSKGKLIRTK